MKLNAKPTNPSERKFRKVRKSITKAHKLSYIFWECTTRCNLSCLHCGSDCKQDSNFPDMPFEDFLKAIQTFNLPKDQAIVVITGGEPLLRKDLPEIGMQLRRHGFRWGIVSNGRAYTSEVHNKLINAGMGALTFSLDGLEENHNWLRGSTQSFEKVIRAIDLAVTYPRINMDIVSCVNQRNLHELNVIYNLLVKKHVKAWRLFTIAPIGRAKNHPELFLDKAQTEIMMQFIQNKRLEGKIDIKYSCEAFAGEYEGKVRDGYFFCRAGINIVSILIDGSISACPNIDRAFVQGNIYKDKPADIWENKFDIMRNRIWMTDGYCADCKNKAICLGSGFHLRIAKNKENPAVCHFKIT